MNAHVQIVALAPTIFLFGVIVELVRRQKLMERYALLWLLCATVLVALEVWQELLALIADGMGISSSVTALFVTAFGFVLALLLHFSLVISKLTKHNKLLAQRLALLQAKVEGLPSAPVGLLSATRPNGRRFRADRPATPREHPVPTSLPAAGGGTT